MLYMSLTFSMNIIHLNNLKYAKKISGARENYQEQLSETGFILFHRLCATQTYHSQGVAVALNHISCFAFLERALLAMMHKNWGSCSCWWLQSETRIIAPLLGLSVWVSAAAEDLFCSDITGLEIW